jgi:hypothetical protein
MKQSFLESIKNHPWEWASGATIVGWLLSRIAARTKRIYSESSSQRPVKHRDNGPIGKLWREVWQFSKPVIAAYLANLLAEHDKSSESKGLTTKWLKNKSLKDVSKGINGGKN